MNKINELISIITPAYNAEKHISDTILSIQRQTYKNWELLISNDCSKDRTADIVCAFASKDPRIKLINAKENGGVAKARNLAIEQSKGKYIAFVDADDLWLPDKLEKQISFMKNRNAAFSFTSYELIDDTGQKIGKYVQSKPIMRHQDILKNTIIGCLTVMVDVEKTGPFKIPILKHTEDNMAWYEILKRGFLGYGMPEVLSQYRISSNSLTSNKLKSAKLQWRTYRDYCKFGILKSMYYFSCYAVNAVIKTRKG